MDAPHTPSRPGVGGASRMPSVPQLRAFLAIAEHLHFRDAASSIGMTQPTLSGSLATLEQNLQIRLVERTTRRVLLTPDGERMLGYARRVVETMDELVDAARRPFTGPLRLGVIPTVAPYLLPSALHLLQRTHPDLELSVHEEQTTALLDGLAEGRLDLLLLSLPVDRPGTHQLPLFEEDFILVTPREHTLACARDLPVSDIPEHELLLLDEGHCLRDQALDVCRKGAIHTRLPGGMVGPGATRAAGLPTLVQLVSSGLGVTLLPRTAVEVEVGRRANLATAEFPVPAPKRQVGLVLRAGSPREEEFRTLANALRAAFDSLPVYPLHREGQGATS